MWSVVEDISDDKNQISFDWNKIIFKWNQIIFDWNKIILKWNRITFDWNNESIRLDRARVARAIGLHGGPEVRGLLHEDVALLLLTAGNYIQLT